MNILGVQFAAWSRVAYAAIAAGALGAVIVINLSVADDLRISQSVILDDEGSISDPLAMTATRGGVYVIAGKSQFGESAIGFRFSKDASKINPLWRYTSERSWQLANSSPGLRFGGAASTPDFRGVAAMSDGSVILCGYGPGGGSGKDRLSLLAHLDLSGRVISEKILLPPKLADRPQDHPLDPNNLGEVVLSGFDACIPWGDNVGIIGRAMHFVPSQINPKIRECRFYHWIAVINAASEIVWQKLIPPPFGSTAITDLTSTLVTPQRNLLITYWLSGQSEVLSVSETGDLVGARQLEGPYIAVNPLAAANSIQLIGGDPKGTKALIRFSENLEEVHREDGLNVPDFVAKTAYGLAGSTLLLIGQKIQASGNISAIRYVDTSRKVAAITLAHGSLFDAGAARVSTPTERPGEILIARTLLERTPGGAERLGIGLDLIGPSRN